MYLTFIPKTPLLEPGANVIPFEDRGVGLGSEPHPVNEIFSNDVDLSGHATIPPGGKLIVGGLDVTDDNHLASELKNLNDQSQQKIQNLETDTDQLRLSVTSIQTEQKLTEDEIKNVKSTGLDNLEEVIETNFYSIFGFPVIFDVVMNGPWATHYEFARGQNSNGLVTLWFPRTVLTTTSTDSQDTIVIENIPESLLPPAPTVIHFNGVPCVQNTPQLGSFELRSNTLNHFIRFREPFVIGTQTGFDEFSVSYFKP